MYRSLGRITAALLLATMVSCASSQATTDFNNLQPADVLEPALQSISDVKNILIQHGEEQTNLLVSQVRSLLDVQESVRTSSMLEYCNASRSAPDVLEPALQSINDVKNILIQHGEEQTNLLVSQVRSLLDVQESVRTSSMLEYCNASRSVPDVLEAALQSINDVKNILIQHGEEQTNLLVSQVRSLLDVQESVRTSSLLEYCNASRSTPVDSTSKSCPEGFHITTNDACYRFYKTATDWSTAWLTCLGLNQHTHLVIINNEDEFQMLKRAVTAITGCSQWWIGAQRIDPNVPSQFVWKTATAYFPLNYTKWERGEPNFYLHDREKESCARMQDIRDYRWYDAVCSDSACFTCQMTLTHE